MPLDRKEPGDSLVWPAATWNRWARSANALLRTTAGAPIGSPLSWAAGPDGRILARDPGGFWAKLAGTTSPYTATQQVRDPATSAWIDGPRALTNVIEVNGGAGLGGTIQFVEPGAPGEWLTQAIRLGGGGCAATLAVTATDSCSGAVLAGVALTATGPGTTVIGTTNGSGLASLIADAAGSWSVQGVESGYLTGAVSATAVCGSTTPVTLSLTPSSLTVTVKNNCTAAPLSGATVQATQGATTVSGTTNVSGVAILNLTAAGSWSLQTSQAGYITDTRSITRDCSTTGVSIPLALTGDTTQLTITVHGCNNLALPGATVVITSGSYTHTDVTNSSGQVVWNHIPVGSWSAVINKVGFASRTLTGTIGGCNVSSSPAATTLALATGYHCCGTSCPDPSPATIHLLDPVLGMVALTYTVNETTRYGDSINPYTGWIGQQNATSQPNVMDQSCNNPLVRNRTVYYGLRAGSCVFMMFTGVCTHTAPTNFKPCLQYPAVFSPFNANNADDRSGPGTSSYGSEINPVGCPITGATYTFSLASDGYGSIGIQAIYGTGTLVFTAST